MVLSLIFYLLFIIGVTILQITKIRKENQMRDIIVYSVLMGMAAFLGSLMILGIPIPSPTKPLKYVFEPIGKLILGS
ncbi:hypothetical protein DNHGIG_26840 [Collibacillus ludicampi]|jgi:hypothetical protein|uniref:Uncharacterized protein n=1 Tax=Collibacillus ludicampi TaxID=2771369 RepID=A0AAV4LH09_9BACL|nr:hypothetical protein [Collibacillus ludicampi]GIM47135.1 hypothetical protein DNHGIG_26840 [Collibacillus ludicampi]